MLAGPHTTVCAVEIDSYCRRVLLARQRDGMLPRFPIWDDVRTFDGRPWRGRVDIVSGGFPCQDVSAPGSGTGLAGKKSGLWSHMARIANEVRPGFVFAENSPLLNARGLDVVIGDLAAMGYGARWCVLGAHNAGAPHERDRTWILAHANGERCKEQGRPGAIPKEIHPTECSGTAAAVGPVPVLRRVPLHDSHDPRLCLRVPSSRRVEDRPISGPGPWGSAVPEFYRVDNGIPARVDRLGALGNAQVPAVAALAWRVLTSGEK